MLCSKKYYYSITSSASSKHELRIERPSAFAVLRLTYQRKWVVFG